MKCETCGVKYHYCSSCGPAWPQEARWCSVECFKKSEDYQEIYDLIAAIHQRGAFVPFCALQDDCEDSAIDCVLNDYRKTVKQSEDTTPRLDRA